MDYYSAIKKKKVREGRWWLGDRADVQLPLGRTEQHMETHTTDFCLRNHRRSAPRKPKEFTDHLREETGHCKLSEAGDKL